MVFVMMCDNNSILRFSDIIIINIHFYYKKNARALELFTIKNIQK